MSARRKASMQRKAKRSARAQARERLQTPTTEAKPEGEASVEALFSPATSRSVGRHLLAYANKVYGVSHDLARLPDARRDPEIPAELLNSALFVSGILRIRSLNALEAELEKKWFAHAVGAEAPAEGTRLFSAETVSRHLVKLGAKGPREVLEGTLHKAERNKVFREGWIAALRFAAIDGWEPIRSNVRHCEHCLERQISVGEGDQKHQASQFFHRLVVALLLGDHEEVVLGFESVRNKADRQAAGEKDADCSEGEETAAIRLLTRLRKTYGRLLDVIVADGLYANGPFLSVLAKLGLGAVIVVKKETDEPLREARNLWANTAPSEEVEDSKAREFIELWDCKDLRTLNTFKGPIRVTRALVHALDAEDDAAPKEWCFMSIGVAATKLTSRQLLRVVRARWHIENTGFNQWTQHWPFEHVFVTNWAGMEALFGFLFSAFNILQLYVYRQLKSYARLKGKDPTKTIISLVARIRDDLVGAQGGPLSWWPEAATG